MNTFFSFLGKLFVFVGIAGILIGGGYYLGTKLPKAPQNTKSITVATTSVPTPTIASASSTITPAKAVADKFVVEAGGASATVYANITYSLSGINGWTLSKKEQPGINQVILTKGEYQLSILQAAMGGGVCVFPGDKPQDMSVILSVPVVQISLTDGTIMKRGKADSSNVPNTETFDVCQKNTEGAYGMPTSFGSISYKAPLNPDPSILTEMDTMVGSLQKK